ncbi:MAG TPA: pitrilysin family protein [Geobacteraceae bacterium]|nr:pitrilysin family protein [Geobacteraceae bacterium]
MVEKTVLNNGVRVITENIPHAYSVSIGIWVTNGSRHERRESNGVAHFIEHLLFKGTKRRNALQIAREIDSVGGVLNAFTSREFVCYYAKVLDTYLPKAVDLLSDIFLNSIFDPEEIEKERKVILQEINMLEDTPDDYIHDLFSQQLWQGNSLGMPIIGNEKSVGKLSRDFIVEYRNRRYCAEDVIIAAAGKVDHKDLLNSLNDMCGSIQAGSARKQLRRPECRKNVAVFDKDLEQVHLCLGLNSLSQDHRERYEAHVMNTILGGSMSSRLFQEVREKAGLAYAIYSYMSAHSDTGSLAVYAGTSHESLDEVIDLTVREFKKLKNEAVSAIELDSAKEQLKGNILLSLESSDNRMSKLAKNEIYFGRYQTFEEIIQGFDRVTAGSLQGLCERLFDEKCATLVLMGKELDGSFPESQLTF